MGISDIMRGATNPLRDRHRPAHQGHHGRRPPGRTRRQSCANFVRDLLRMKAEIIAKNFDAETLTRMTGEEVTPRRRGNPARRLLTHLLHRHRDRQHRRASTRQIEQESNAKIMMAMQGIMQGAAGPAADRRSSAADGHAVHPGTDQDDAASDPQLQGRRRTASTTSRSSLQAAAMLPPPMMPPPGGPPGAGPPGATPPGAGPPAGPPPGPTQMNGGGAPMPMGPMG